MSSTKGGMEDQVNTIQELPQELATAEKRAKDAQHEATKLSGDLAGAKVFIAAAAVPNGIAAGYSSPEQGDTADLCDDRVDDAQRNFEDKVQSLLEFYGDYDNGPPGQYVASLETRLLQSFQEYYTPLKEAVSAQVTYYNYELYAIEIALVDIEKSATEQCSSWPITPVLFRKEFRMSALSFQ